MVDYDYVRIKPQTREKWDDALGDARKHKKVKRLIHDDFAIILLNIYSEFSQQYFAEIAKKKVEVKT